MVVRWCGDRPPDSKGRSSHQQRSEPITDYRLDLSGPLPEGLIEEIPDRFDEAEIHVVGDGVSIRAGGLDQPALRALLGLLWDVGAQVRSITDVTPTPGERGDGVVRDHPDRSEGPVGGVVEPRNQRRKP